MTSVASKFGIVPVDFPQESDLIINDRRLGIEIEQEYSTTDSARSVQIGFRSGQPITEYWACTRDGSLRNMGYEFVSHILWPYKVSRALDLVLPHVSRGVFSWRAGIHVHVDAADLDDEQLRSMAKLYAMLEPVIFEWEGTNRDQSRFCVPWYTCNAGVRSMFEAVASSAGSINDAFNRFGKYTALNMIPLCSLGTVEFRHMQTTEDKERIINYINLCLGIVQAGRDNVDVLRLFSSSGTEAFIREIFGKHGEFLLQVPDLETLLWRGMDCANAICLSELKTNNRNTQRVPDVKTLLTKMKKFEQENRSSK